MTDEILRTATSSVRLRPILDRIVASLGQATLKTVEPGQLPFSAERLMEISAEYRQCEQGMRRHEMMNPESLFITFLRERAESFMNVGDDAIESLKPKDVKAVLECLTIFKSKVPEHELAGELQKWMTKHSSKMALSELLDFARVSDKDGVCDMSELVNVMERCKKLKVETWNAIFVASLVLTSHRAFKKEAGLQVSFVA